MNHNDEAASMMTCQSSLISSIILFQAIIRQLPFIDKYARVAGMAVAFLFYELPIQTQLG
jgi:hypothetical protein